MAAIRDRAIGPLDPPGDFNLAIDDFRALHGFLGVPVILRGVAFGRLDPTEKTDGSEFTTADDELIARLAVQAAVAIDDVRTSQAATGWLGRLEATSPANGTTVRAAIPPR